MAKSKQRPTWKEILTNPEGSVFGSPGDLAYATQTEVLWIKEKGFGTPLGWRPVGGGGSEDSVFTPQQFGAQGGGADDTVPIQAALNAAGVGGGQVLLSELFQATAQLEQPSGVEVLGVGPDAGISFENADPADFPSGAMLRAAGSLAALPAISAAISAGDLIITFGADHGLSEGDVVVFTDTALFNTARPYYNAGEYVRVAEVLSSTQIEVDQPVYGDYPTPGNLTAWSFNAARVSLKNVQLVGIGVTTLPIVEYSLCSAFVEDVRATGSQRAFVRLDRCYESQVLRLNGFDHGASIGLNYGVEVANCQKIEIGRCQLSTTRHAVTTGGAADDGNAVNREVRVFENQLAGGTLSYSADLHGNSEWCTYEHNNLRGLSIGGQNHTIRSNDIQGGEDGIALFMIEVRSPSFDIIDNTFLETVDVTVSSVSGLLKWSETPSFVQEEGTLKIQGNTINMGSFAGRAAVFRNFSAVTSLKAEVENNVMRRDDATDPLALVNFDGGGAGGGWESVRFLGNQMQSISIRAAAVQDLDVLDNTVLASGQNAIEYAIEAANPFSFTRIRCIGNTVLSADDNGVRLVGDAALTTSALLVGNTSLNNRQGGGSASATASVYTTDIDTVVMRNNVLGDDQAVPTQQRVWRVDNCVYLDEGSNTDIGALAIKGVQVSVTQRVTRTIGINQNTTNRETVGTAAPATGTWTQGDITWNTAVAVGQPQGWRCTVSGTPGTWVAMPVL